MFTSELTIDKIDEVVSQRTETPRRMNQPSVKIETSTLHVRCVEGKSEGPTRAEEFPIISCSRWLQYLLAEWLGTFSFVRVLPAAAEFTTYQALGYRN